MNITDPFNGADTQNCAFSHDDLTRLASVNCGSIWSQTFSYDAFGNISKSGTYNFLPIYKDPSGNTTNRFVSIPGATVAYDANGSVLSDGSHSYSWDSNGKSVSTDSVGITYDALGRPVEQNRSGAYTQFVYAPGGGKLAIMVGQTLQKGLVPLPGGGIAVYNSSGLLYYGHSDHLGSVRLGSTTTRTIRFDIAYAPFGETYATSGSTDPSFTGQRQDTVAGLYDFPERQYSTQGRWPTPDPSGIASMHLADPQSLNRYAYVRNNPLALVDPNGLDDCFCEGWEEELGGDWGGGGGGNDPTSGGDLGNGGSNPNDCSIPANNCSVSSTLLSCANSDLCQSGQTDDSLQGSVLGQMLDTNQCSDCMAILNGANTAVEIMGYAELGGAALVLTDGLAAELAPAVELAPTLTTATEYATSIGVEDSIAVVPEIVGTQGTEMAGMTLQGDIVLSDAAFSSEETLVKTLAEESMHLSQQAAMGVPEASAGSTAPLEATAKAFANLIWELFKAGQP